MTTAATIAALQSVIESGHTTELKFKPEWMGETKYLDGLEQAELPGELGTVYHFTDTLGRPGLVIKTIFGNVATFKRYTDASHHFVGMRPVALKALVPHGAWEPDDIRTLFDKYSNIHTIVTDLVKAVKKLEESK